MEITAQEDIEGSLDTVFASLSNFEQFERAILRRGVEVRRLDTLDTPAIGMRWQSEFKYRGKMRNAEIELTRFDAPHSMQFQSKSAGLTVVTDVDCVALSRTRTRIGIVCHMQPKTLSARILVQSIKLARGSVQRKFRTRVSDFAREFERKLKSA